MHRGLADIHECCPRQGVLQFVPGGEVDMVELNPDVAPGVGERLHRCEKIVPLPIRVQEMRRARALTVWPPAIDIGCDRNRLLVSHHEPVGPAKRTVEKIAKIVHIVNGCEDGGIDIVLCHILPQHAEPRSHLRLGKHRPRFVAVGKGQCLGHLHGITFGSKTQPDLGIGSAYPNQSLWCASMGWNEMGSQGH